MSTRLAEWLQLRIGTEAGKRKAADIARRMEESESLVSRWKAGKSNPTRAHAKALAAVLGEPEAVVLALAGYHVGDAPSAATEDPFTLLERALALLARERSTPGPYGEGQSSGTLVRAHPRRRVARATVSTPMALIALIEEWITTMPEADYRVVIAGDWLRPAVADGDEILITPAGEEQPGDQVIARLGDRVLTGQMPAADAPQALLADGGEPIPLADLVIVAVIAGWVTKRRPTGGT